MTLEELVVVITAETSKLEKGLKKTTSGLNSVQKTAKKMSSNVSNSFKSLNKNVNNTFKSIAKAVSLTAVFAGLLKLGKTALDTASDLEEVQNVVNVTFGAAAAEINKFSKEAIRSFGLGELSAKKYASTFMAMSNGMGIAADSGKTMAIELTKLVGDMSSFYNVSQDIASTALSSIYTGETESLKKFGVVMTEANLQAFALSRGITKQVNAMSQAEKVALRYNFVMAQTAQAQGDFARTGGSWANQVRVLKEQYASFMAVLGTALKQVLLPVLNTLNSILSTLITTAQTAFSMMGIKFDIEGSSVSSTVEGVENIETGFEGANQAAKALDKTITGFDELNILNSKGSGAGAGGGAGTGGIEIEQGKVTTEPVEQDGAILGGLDNMLDKLNGWFDNKMGPWLSEKSTWLAEKINGLVANTPWGELGETVANGLNHIVTALDNFFSTVDGYQLGSGLGTLLNKFVEKFDAYELGAMLGEKLKLGLEIAIGFLDTVDAEEFGKAIADFVNGLEVAELSATLGEFLSKVVVAALEGLNAFIENLDEGEFKEAFGNFFGNIDMSAIGEQVGTLITNVDELIDSLTGVENTLRKLIVTLTIITGLSLLGKLLTFTEAWGHFMAGVVGGRGILGSLGDTFAWIGIVLQQKFADKLGVTVKTLEAFGGKVLGVGTKIKAGIGAALTSLKGTVAAAFGAIKTAISSAISFIIANPITLVIAAIVALVALIAAKGDEIQELLGKLNNWLTGVFEKDWTEVFGPVLGDILNGFFANFKNIWDGIYQVLNGVIDMIRGVFTGDWKRAWEGVKKVFKGVWDSLVAVAKAPFNLIIGLVNGLLKAITNGLNAVINRLKRISIKVPDWVPVFGGKTWGFSSLRTFSAPQVPYLADGGVVYNPTLAMVGEYSGASTNPEIVTPQSLLQEIINSGNDELINVMIQLGRQVVGAIENKELAVAIGDDVIANSAARGNRRYYKQTGRPLITVG